MKLKILAFFSKIGSLTELFISFIKWSFIPPFEIRELIRQMNKIGVDSLPVVVLTSSFTGMVMALQTYSVLVRFSAEGYVGSLVGLSMVRELGCVLTALVVAGRCGSSMGAEIGTMKVTEQIDALLAMATNPINYLVVPRVWAATLVLPMLVSISNVIGILGGYFITVGLMGANSAYYWKATFEFMYSSDVTSGLIKSAFFGFILSIIGCHEGLTASHGAKGVGKATTSAVVIGSITILISDFFLTKLLF